MPKIRHAYTRDFTLVTNQLAQDSRLSYKARGVFLYLWSLPDEWEISLKALEHHSEQDGQAAVRTAVTELLDRRYIAFRRVHAEGTGKFTDTEWTLTDNPSLDFPHVDNPSLDNHNTLKDSRSKDRRSKKDKLQEITPYENADAFSTGVPLTQPPTKARRAATETPTPSLVWQAYAAAYHDRYGTPPVRNARVNAQLKQFVQRVPQEEAPHIAAFYVWHTSAYYQTRGHSIGVLLADAEKLHTEWTTNRPILATQARQQEKTASNPFLPILERLQKEAENAQR